MAGNVFNSIGSSANSAFKATNSALGSVTEFATSTLPATTSKAINSVFDSVSDFATSTVPSTATSAINSAIGAINSAATSTLATMSNAVPNSLLPFSTNATTLSKNNSKHSNNSNLGMFANVNMNTRTNGARTNNSGSNNTNSKKISFPIIIFFFLVGIITLTFIVFKSEISLAYENIVVSIRKAFGMDTSDIKKQKKPYENVDVSKSPDTYLDKQYDNDKDENSIIEKVLPMGTNEVFNVSENSYNYYDAEPLCQALGAELASYDQVKQAWQKGADWCNYGWVKGQVAIYPTQESTWEKLQHGPQDERNACGQPGVNGGYFDNPEMKFGVNCYGVKPDQSANDEKILMQNGSIPKTVSGLKVDQKIQEIKGNIDRLGVLPFSNDKWSSS
jgi:hypothetical protein